MITLFLASAKQNCRCFLGLKRPTNSQTPGLKHRGCPEVAPAQELCESLGFALSYNVAKSLFEQKLIDWDALTNDSWGGDGGWGGWGGRWGLLGKE